ncbi:leucine-rich repeat domain-containing protein, partial [Gardnerella vaginalis]|uniref:leucine-rich repeat domain-containing protein n=1 Tax=Gardnerella vaginalis TaxID=2702 RepID=UPI0039704768
MESSKKKRNSVLPIIVSVGIATSMGVVANSTPEVAYASGNATTPSIPSTTTYADRSSSYYDDDNQVIDIPDENLKKRLLECLRAFAYIDSDVTEITIAKAKKLTDLSTYLYYSDIYNLTGLEYFQNLKGLSLDNNHISDLTPLKNLTNLENLGLEGNQVRDLTPLKNLTNLENLGLEGNQVRDLTPLKNLTNLENLGLEGNQ